MYAESKFQQAAVTALRLNKIFVFSVPNGMKLKITQARIAKAEGLTSGCSDVIILLPKSRAIFVEFKNPNGKGRQSPTQKEFQDTVTNLGFEYKIWDKWEQVQEFIKKESLCGKK